jgi:hypothetical protein
MAPPAEQLVGRAAELEVLDQALAELRRGRASALAIVGEPGRALVKSCDRDRAAAELQRGLEIELAPADLVALTGAAVRTLRRDQGG